MVAGRDRRWEGERRVVGARGRWRGRGDARAGILEMRRIGLRAKGGWMLAVGVKNRRKELDRRPGRGILEAGLICRPWWWRMSRILGKGELESESFVMGVRIFYDRVKLLKMGRDSWESLLMITIE